MIPAHEDENSPPAGSFDFPREPSARSSAAWIHARLSRPRFPSRTWRWVGSLLELSVVLMLLHFFLGLGGAVPSADALEFRPVPDAVEYVWVADALAHGRSALMPVVNEWHPSRYSIVHPLMMSLWMQARGGSLESVWSWSPVAVWLGLLVLYFGLLRARVLWPFRLAFLYLALFTPMTFESARNLLQEPSLLLLFAVALVCLHEGLLRMGSPRHAMSGGDCPDTPREPAWFPPLDEAPRRIIDRASIFLFISGAFGASLACVRPSLAAFPLLCLGVIVMLSWRQRGRIIAYLLGGITCIVGLVLITWIATGRPRLYSYYHWNPEHGPGAIRWGQAFAFPGGLGPLRQWQQVFSDWLGLTPGITMAGWVSCMVLLVCELGACFSRWNGKPNAADDPTHSAMHRRLVHVLLLFCLSQVVFHCFYDYYHTRFFIVSFPAFAWAGILGMDRLLKTMWKRKRISAWMVASLGVVMLFAVLGPVGKVAESLVISPRERILRRDHTQSLYAHRRLGQSLVDFRGPVFLDAFPGLNARLLLGLREYPHPFAPFRWSNDLYFEGHVVQFHWFRVRGARGYLADRGVWSGRPNKAFLFDPLTHSLNEAFLDHLMGGYGAVALYSHDSRERERLEAFAALRERGYALRERGHSGGWRIRILERESITDANPP